MGDTKRIWRSHFHRALDLPELLTADCEQPYLQRDGILAMLVLAVAHSIFARSMDVMTRDAAEDVTFSPIDKSEWRMTARVRAEYTSAFRLVGEAVQATGVGRKRKGR